MNEVNVYSLYIHVLFEVRVIDEGVKRSLHLTGQI